MQPLSDKQATFIREIMKGRSQRKAYLTAYPSSKKWQLSTVDSRASNLMRNGKVVARLSELRKAVEKTHNFDRDTVLDKVAAIGYAPLDPKSLRAPDILRALELISRIMGFDKDVSNNQLAILAWQTKGHNLLVAAIRQSDDEDPEAVNEVLQQITAEKAAFSYTPTPHR
jgi:hypothetical protein